MVLNNADNIMIGSDEVDRVYCGSVLVWERFPDGYTQLNYIESHGAQWISPQMTDPILTDTVRIQTKFAFTSIDSTWQAVAKDLLISPPTS